MAAGDIGPVIDTGTFDVISGNESSVIHVSGDVYAIAYRGQGNHGHLCTLTIDDLGNIGAVIDTLEFDNVSGFGPCLIHVSGDVYAIAYYNTTSNDGILKTVTIDSGGNIGVVIDTFVFDATLGWTPQIIHISGDVFAIAYRGPGDDGWLCTVTIDSGGNIGAAVIDTLEFDVVYGSEPQIIHVSGDVYAIAYEAAAAGATKVCTVTIDSSGNIGAAVIDIHSFACGAGGNTKAKIIHVSGDVFAVVSQDLSLDGQVGTITIDNSGNIFPVYNDTFEFDTTQGTYPDIIHIWLDIFAIAYAGSAGGTLITLSIAADGTIGAIIDTLGFDNGVDIYPRLIYIGDVYAVVYNHAPGTVKTMDIESVVLATVTTDAATALSATAATPNGTLDDDGNEACDCGFEWGETTAYGTTTATQSKNSGETFSQAISGLAPNTTYHFRAIATNSKGTSYGSDQTFTTLAEPTVTTDPATSVEETAATPNGTLDDDGNEACDCGFEYGETTDYGTTTATQSKTSGETFEQAITGLTAGKHYHFRAIATNSAGTSYGSDRSFFAKGGYKGNPNIDQLIYQHAERMD